MRSRKDKITGSSGKVTKNIWVRLVGVRTTLILRGVYIDANILPKDPPPLPSLLGIS